MGIFHGIIGFMRSVLLTDTDGLFVTNPTNVRYLTGFRGVSPEEREAYALVTTDTIYLFTSALYRETTKQFSGVHQKAIEISYDHPITAALSEVCDKTRIKTVGFEETNLTVWEFQTLKQSLPGITLTPTHGRVEALRQMKNTEELKSTRLAASLTDRCFAYIKQRLKPGITEGKLAWEIENFLNFKAGGNAFSPIVAFNEHSAMPHYHERGNNPLRKGSLVLLDFGAKINGYCADMTRVVFLGTPKDAWVSTYTTVLAANEKALALLKNGERNGATLDAVAREVIAGANLPVYPHSLGHAVGLEIHEAPRLTIKKAETLKPGMIVTVEPGVYVEGTYGIRIEDLILINANSIELLSKSTKEITIL